jgi:hypothetical protein
MVESNSKNKEQAIVACSDTSIAQFVRSNFLGSAFCSQRTRTYVIYGPFVLDILEDCECSDSSLALNHSYYIYPSQS